ncbi:Nucleotide-diphospho-sugar transferase [Cinnamomum micranthum f. kanehirae]|uniref:Nucleotide-diphospho-sugar transferase n=1 Tax=Cinnamomum micranthum f. kanehirae TaxID=337451 RepID=A0A3S3MR22_9MAGN|nr:Nucleotide-diphospho-sugar transferase [Cinnamomum micranthum f. kanehirae]
MENKTLIITVVNKAYTKEGSLLDLFLQSFQLGEETQFLRNHLLVAIDQTAFDQCNLQHLHCYKFMTDGRGHVDSCDVYKGQPLDWANPINTGFYLVASNNETIALFDTWYAAKNESEGLEEQDVIGQLIREGVIERLGLRVRFLDALYFGGFCSSGRDYGKVVTIPCTPIAVVASKQRSGT